MRLNITVGRLVIGLPIIFYFLLFVFNRTFLGELVISFLPMLILATLVYLLISLLIFVRIFRRLIWYFLSALIIIVASCTIVLNSYYGKVRLSSDAGAPTQQALRILSFNINAKNNEYGLVESLITNNDAEIIAFYEFRPHHYDSLKNALNSYRYSNYAALDPPVITVFSKVPIADIITYERFMNVKIRLTKDNLLSLYLVHLTVPIYPDLFAMRNNELNELKQTILDDTSNNIIVTGDFNLTPWSYYYSKFTDNLGLEDISMDGFKYTWHAYNSPLMPLHIDHSFVSSGIKKESYTLLDESGSDHKPQLISISL